jgi:hypothetical protein
MRQREKLVAGASTCIQHILKALTEMNIQLANVISDISGMTGMAILRAIVSGERNPQALARLKGERIHATREEIAQSLEGTWRPELLFVLEQSLALYDIYQQTIAECNVRIEAHLKSIQLASTSALPDFPSSACFTTPISALQPPSPFSITTSGKIIGRFRRASVPLNSPIRGTCLAESVHQQAW